MCGIFVCFGVRLFVVARIWSFVVFDVIWLLCNYTVYWVWCNLSKLFVVVMCKYVVMRLLGCEDGRLRSGFAGLSKVKSLAINVLVVFRVPENGRQPF